MKKEEREKYSYLGDGVYAYFDGYAIWLRTGHHEESQCDNQICLEPDVLHSLNLFNQRVWEKTKNIRLDEESFKCLVGGGVVHCGNTRIALADIGYQTMLDAIDHSMEFYNQYNDHIIKE